MYGGALMTVGHKPLQEGEVLDVQLQWLVLISLYRHTIQRFATADNHNPTVVAVRSRLVVHSLLIERASHYCLQTTKSDVATCAAWHRLPVP